jgi:hypothetical protein
MPMYNLNLLTDHDIAEDGEEGEDGREGGFAVDGPEGDVVGLEAIGEISHTCSARVGVRDDDDFVAAINEFLTCVSGCG